MEKYLGTVVIDDPHAGKQAYAFVDLEVGVDMYWLSLMTPEGVEYGIGMYERVLRNIEDGKANKFQTERKDDTRQSLAAFRQALEDLKQTQEANGIINRAPVKFKDTQEIFRNDGFITLDVPGRGEQVFAALRQKRKEGSVIVRRYENIHGLKRLLDIDERYSKNLESDQEIAPEDQEAIDFLQDTIAEAVKLQQRIDQTKRIRPAPGKGPLLN